MEITSCVDRFHQTDLLNMLICFCVWLSGTVWSRKIQLVQLISKSNVHSMIQAWHPPQCSHTPQGLFSAVEPSWIWPLTTVWGQWLWTMIICYFRTMRHNNMIINSPNYTLLSVFLCFRCPADIYRLFSMVMFKIKLRGQWPWTMLIYNGLYPASVPCLNEKINYFVRVTVMFCPTECILLS